MEFTNKDVLPDPSPVVREDAKPQEPKAEVPEVAPQKASEPGSKTPETNLLAALHMEREEKRKLAERVKQLETSTPPAVEAEVFSDEGRAIYQEVSSLKGELERMKDQSELERLFASHPELRDSASEFSEFRAQYPGVPLEKVARLFLSEKGLVSPARKGLEQSSGGAKTPPPASMTDDELKRLREHNPRKWQQLVMEGKV